MSSTTAVLPHLHSTTRFIQVDTALGPALVAVEFDGMQYDNDGTPLYEHWIVTASPGPHTYLEVGDRVYPAPERFAPLVQAINLPA